MNRETFVAILSASLAEADEELLREAEGLVFWRKRELRSAAIQQYQVGWTIRYLAKDGKTRRVAPIDHLNKFSVTVKHSHPTEGFTTEVVPLERILGYDDALPRMETQLEKELRLAKGYAMPPSFGSHAKETP